MWQFFLAAAVAGSGIFARHLFFNPRCHSTVDPDSRTTRNRRLRPRSVKPNNPNCVSSTVSAEPVPEGSTTEGGGVFRFSSQNSTDQDVLASNIKCFVKSNRIPKRKCKRIGVQRLDKRSTVFVKKRGIDEKSAVTGSRSSCSSAKGVSLFGFGFGFGMMCMSSARKTEAITLSTSMSELKTAIKELQILINKGKASGRIHSSNSIKGSAFLRSEDGECESSVLTDEPVVPETVEMNQLHAELESELQKIPGCLREEYHLSESEEGGCFDGENGEVGGVESSGFKGVTPSELETRLFHVLIQQQGSQIEGLESQLLAARSKLHDRESELLALKDCVRRLTAFTVSTASDDECEGNMEKYTKEVSTVGSKRPIESTT